MSELKGTTPSILRIDTSRTSEYLYADRPKLTFMQKLGRSVGKAMSFLGPIGAAITAPFCLPAAAGIYGLSRVASDATSNALSNDSAKMQQYNQQVANQPVSFPGLFESMSDSEITTDFIAPSQYSSGIQDTLINRDQAQMQSMRSF